MDYLSKIGYEEEMELWKHILFNTFFNISCDARPIYKLFLLHKEFGTISKDNYEFYFESENEYEKIVNYMSQFTGNPSFKLYYKSWYVIGAMLSTFMYMEYKKDSNFLKVILDLHGDINQLSPMECFQKMGLKDLWKKIEIN